MTSGIRTMIGWLAIAACGGAGFVMNGLRIQYLNFNLYVAICIVAAVALVLGSRVLSAEADPRTDPNTNDNANMENTE